MATVSFQKDIVPMFYEFRGPMLWRLDLTKYEDVKANASMLYNQMIQKNMPPPPFPSFSADQTQLFQQWMTEGFQP
jgi:hypothetical protein